MNNEKFVYVTYIATTPEKVWNALLDSELSAQYWGHENQSDSGWKPGSKWQLVSADSKRTVRHVGQVLENVPQKRLVITWADPEYAADDTKQTRVSYDIETVGDMARLTVTHDHLYAEMAAKISNGWPRVLSSLKSFLETGRALNTFCG